MYNVRKEKSKVISALLFLFLLCCACNKGNGVSVKSWGGSKPDSGVRVSAELLSEKTEDVQTPFEIKVGIGNSGIYSAGILEIKAPGFEITDAEGATCTDEYTRLYEDFKEETYGYRIEDEKDLGLKYFEFFQFEYIGEEENGEIAFWISAL